MALKKIIMHHEKDGVTLIPALCAHSTSSKPALLTDTFPSLKFPITALREIKLLKLLSHKNILRLEDMAVEHPSRPSTFPSTRVYHNRGAPSSQVVGKLIPPLLLSR